MDREAWHWCIGCKELDTTERSTELNWTEKLQTQIPESHPRIFSVSFGINPRFYICNFYIQTEQYHQRYYMLKFFLLHPLILGHNAPFIILRPHPSYHFIPLLLSQLSLDDYFQNLDFWKTFQRQNKIKNQISP